VVGNPESTLESSHLVLFQESGISEIEYVNPGYLDSKTC